MLLNDETTRVSADEKRRLGGRRLWVGTVALALAVFGAVTGPVAPAQAAPTEVTTITQLADAMSNANDGETLVVQADISGAESDPDVEVKAGAGVTLDLNGYVVTIVGSLPASPEVLGSGHPGIWVPASSSLTIVDTSTDGGGTLNATGAGWSAGIGGNYAAPGGAQ